MRSSPPPDPPESDGPRVTTAHAGPDRDPVDIEPAPPPERRISLSFDIFAVSQRLGTYLDRALEGTGVRPVEYAVYSLMLEAGPRTPTELSAMLGMPLSTVSTYLAGMLRRGDARRIPNPADGRSVRVVLTDRGRGVVRRVNPPFSRAHQALEASLDRPVGEVRAVLAGIVAAIDRAEALLDGEPAARSGADADATDSSSS
jgi:DNA-binding MarR family transcriptional regulator